MKNILTICWLTFTCIATAQNQKISKNATIHFEASVPAFEEVKAISNTASMVVDIEKKNIAALVLMKSFKFKIALMQEHFNENYVESDKYPKATFVGKIEDFDWDKMDNETDKYSITGVLQMHGKSKEIKTTATLKKVQSQLAISTYFIVDASDFGIEIPSVVKNKVAKKVKINLTALLK